MKVSINIVSRNRAYDLAATLACLRSVVIPEGVEVEVVVVDNGSTDGTCQVAKEFVGEFRIRYFREERQGQCFGRNTGLERSSGDIIMMLDDDVIVDPKWFREMLRKFDDPNVMGVAGGIDLCPSLCRPWMTPLHKSWLACTVDVDPALPKRMVGANMAIRRSVLDRIPEFDTELGPGRLGFADDSLFSAQMLFANMRIVYCSEAPVIHRPDISRLDRSSWLDAARRRGESDAYVGYHWQHWGNRLPVLKKKLADLGLLRWRIYNRKLMTSPEGCSETELKLVWGQALVAALNRESAKRRKYEYCGLVKIK